MVETHLSPSPPQLPMKMNLSFRKNLASRKHLAKKLPSRNHLQKNALKPRKTSKKNCTTRKQRCISSYFQSAASSSTSNDKILELLSAISEQTTKLSDQVSELKNESKLLRKLLKRKKTPTCLKRSAFHTLLDLSKKGRQAHRGCQTEPTEPTTADLSHQTVTFLCFCYVLFLHYVTLRSFYII